MAEPAGIFIEVDIEEKNVKKLLNHKFDGIEFGKKIGYYFSQLLYELRNAHKDVFIFNYDAKSGTCFIALVHNHLDQAILTPFLDVLHIISLFKKPNTTNYALVATIYPDVLDAYQINMEQVKKVTKKEVPNEIVEKLFAKFWSFSKNDGFPIPQKALNKRNYFYKNFKNYYKKYSALMEEKIKPEKIAQATKNTPFLLFDNFYTYDNKVFEFIYRNKVFMEILKADPLSLRKISNWILADKNYVFQRILIPNPHPKFVKSSNSSIPSFNDVYQYLIAQGIDGASFNYVEKFTYWKDKNSVFTAVQGQLKKVEHADIDSFKYLDFAFGKDKNHIFYKAEVIPINPISFTLNKNGFIFDSEHIFHYQNKIPLDAKTFKVLKYESETNPFYGTFLLEDKNGKYEYNNDWENEKIKPNTV